MKVFTFKYRRALDSFVLSAMKKAISTGKPSIHSDILYFDNLDDLMRSASKSRLELFQSIREKKPSSLYELAQLIHKDQSYVLRESKALESIGLISLTSVKDGGREKLKPEALYDKILIEVNFEEENSRAPAPSKKRKVA
jgi:predicted transcriptional regulator